MKTAFKILAGLLVLIVIALAAVIITFDPNDYKPQITAAVEQHTGRTLIIEGDISLSVFPWIGLEVGKLSLSNAAGFSKSDFARMQQLDIKVKLLPLLASRVEIDKIRLHGLFVSLETHKDGKTNWQDLAGEPAPGDAATTPAAEAAATDATTTDATAAPVLSGFLVDGIEFVGATFQWIDNKSGVEAKISDLNLETGAIKFDAWIPVNFSAHVKNSAPEVDATIKLATQIKINQALNVFDIEGFRLDVSTLMKSLAAERIELTVKMEASADLEKQTVKLSTLNLSAMGASLNTSLTITGLDTQPLIKGTLTSNTIQPRELAAKLGITLPDSRDAWAMTALNISARVEANADYAKLDELVLTLDKSKLSGFVHVNKLAQPDVSYQLALDSIDVDAYLPAPVDAALVPEPVASTEPAPDVPIDLPLELLRALGLNGEFRIAALRVSDIAIKDMLIKTHAAGGVIKIDPISMKLLDGSFAAGLTLDARTTPSYLITAKGTDLKPGEVINPLLAGLLGNQELAIEGIAQFAADIKTNGTTLNTLKQKAVGTIDLNMGHTSVTGIDIDFYLRDAVATYVEGKKLSVPDDFRGTYTPQQKTAFDKVVITAKLADGKVNNDQLLLDSKRLKVKGGGVINIMDNTLDEKITVQLDAGREKTIAEKVLQKPVGVRIHGPFAAPAIDIDYASLGKAITSMLGNEAKEKVQEKVDAAKEDLEAKIEAEKQKLKAEQEAKKAEAEQKLKDKAKDKLKGLFR